MHRFPDIPPGVRARQASALCSLFACTLAMLGLQREAGALTPASPQVKQAIESGLAFLEKSSGEEARLGGKCLVALCLLKNDRPVSHPLIQAAVKACQDSLKDQHNEVYSPGLATVFLCELESQQPAVRDLAQAYIDLMVQRQQPGGGWGYLTLKTGDTSQTQYGALALWTAANRNHDVPQDAVERLCGWLVRTQDPTGTWGYQGIDPGAYRRMAQPNEKRISLHVGGIGSLYITADLLGLNRGNQPAGDSGLPPALRAIGKPAEEKRQPGKLGPLTLFDPGLVRSAIADGDKFFAQTFTIAPKEHLYYYLYGLERYQSFRELALGRVEKEPGWYNQGADLLLSTQSQSGSWAGGGENQVIGTSFAVLFLCRSSGKSIAKSNPNLGDGTLLGGMGLPPNVTDLIERDGKIVETPLAGSIDEMLALIEKPNAELDALVDPRQPLTLDGDVTKRAGQVAKLRALVSAGSYEARLLAVKTLGRTRELDNVPVLIYALSDPDLRIVLAADRALRFYSRKFSGVGLPDEPKPADVAAASKAWKSWYKSVRPEAEFLD